MINININTKNSLQIIPQLTCINSRMTSLPLWLISDNKNHTVINPTYSLSHKAITTHNLIIIIINNHSSPDRTTSSPKISDSQISKNYKTHPHSILIHSYQKHNLSKDQQNQDNKNPSSTKENSRNSNFNNSQHSISILSGDKTIIGTTGQWKRPIKINYLSTISNMKILEKNKNKNCNSSFIKIKILVSMINQPNHHKHHHKRMFSHKIYTKKQPFKIDTQTHFLKIKNKSNN